MSALPAVQRAVEEVDRNQPLIDPRTEDSYLAEQAQYPRYYSMLLGLFAAVATGLAAVGIYGVMAYAGEQRTREIGIRMALGAGGWDVLTLIFRQAVIVIAGEAAVGIAGDGLDAIHLVGDLGSEDYGSGDVCGADCAAHGDRGLCLCGAHAAGGAGGPDECLAA